MWGEGDHGHETVLVILYGCTKMKVQLLEFVIILPLNHRFHFPVTGIGPFVKVEKKTDKMIECSNSGLDEVVMMRLMKDEASQLFEHPPPFLHGDM
jgi:hypothetical protein